MSDGRLAAIVCGGLVAVLALSGCESSQSKSARLRAQAKTSAPEQGLRIAAVSADVRVTASTVLNDVKAKRSAAVITLRNTSPRELTGLPLLFTLSDGAGKQVFTNASPGASPDLTTVPSLRAGGTLDWVNDAIVNVAGAKGVEAKIGAGAAAPGSVPRLRLSRPKLESDVGGGYTAVGTVFNASSVAQRRLVIFAVARRGGRIVAAGRAVVPTVEPGPKGAPFTAFLVGDPRGAKLSVTAPPVSFGGAG